MNHCDSVECDINKSTCDKTGAVQQPDLVLHKQNNILNTPDLYRSIELLSSLAESIDNDLKRPKKKKLLLPNLEACRNQLLGEDKGLPQIVISKVGGSHQQISDDASSSPEDECDSFPYDSGCECNYDSGKSLGGPPTLRSQMHRKLLAADITANGKYQ